MGAVIQRVSSASVSAGNRCLSEIGRGLVILVGIEEEDSEVDAGWLAAKIVQLRIFDDNNGVMNLPVTDAAGSIMVISQFTLHAKTKKGNRPSYIKAARPEKAKPLYEFFVNKITELTGRETATGEFGAMMDVALVNNGPVTIIIDTKEKE